MDLKALGVDSRDGLLKALAASFWEGTAEKS